MPQTIHARIVDCKHPYYIKIIAAKTLLEKHARITPLYALQ